MSSTATGGKEKQMTFTIDTENNITAFADEAQADSQGERFSTQQELAELAANWPAARLVETWNSLPGLTPVKKFKDRKSALARIWKAIQSLNGDAAPKSAKAARKPAKKAKRAAKAKPAKAAAKNKRAKMVTAGTREGSKKAEVLALLQRKGGASLKQIMDATGWQAHSVRGFISGTLGKKMGLTVESTKREDGERVYQIAG
jgi:hypothetical protein